MAIKVTYIQHYGILGMRWGRRKNNDSSEHENNVQALKDVRRVYEHKGSGKDPSKMSDREIDDEIIRISSRPQNARIRANIDRENARLAAKASHKNPEIAADSAAVLRKHDKSVRKLISGPVSKKTMNELESAAEQKKIQRARAESRVIWGTILGSPLIGYGIYRYEKKKGSFD